MFIGIRSSPVTSASFQRRQFDGNPPAFLTTFVPETVSSQVSAKDSDGLTMGIMPSVIVVGTPQRVTMSALVTSTASDLSHPVTADALPHETTSLTMTATQSIPYSTTTSDNTGGVNGINSPPTHPATSIPVPAPSPSSGLIAGIVVGVLTLVIVLVMLGWYCLRQARATAHKADRIPLWVLASGKGKKRGNDNDNQASLRNVYVNNDVPPLGKFMTNLHDRERNMPRDANSKSLGEPGPVVEGRRTSPTRPGPAFFQQTNRSYTKETITLSDPFISPTSTNSSGKTYTLPQPPNPGPNPLEPRNSKPTTLHGSPYYHHHQRSGPTNGSTHSTISVSSLSTIASPGPKTSTEIIYIGKARTEDITAARRYSFVPRIIDVSLPDLSVIKDVRSRSTSPAKPGEESSLDDDFHTTDCIDELDDWHSFAQRCGRSGTVVSFPPDAGLCNV